MTAFAFDPVASHSAQFPLARPLAAPTGNEEGHTGSPATPEPWGLRGLRPGRDPMDGVPTWHYDHAQQMAFDDDHGLPLHEIHAGITTTNMDGSEGPSEDWSARDFAPDVPFPAAS